VARARALALALTLIGLTEAISSARAVALRSGQRIDGNQEFIGQGLANIAGAFTSSYPTSGSFNRNRRELRRRGTHAARRGVLGGLPLLILFLVRPSRATCRSRRWRGAVHRGVAAHRPPRHAHARARQPGGSAHRSW
jgi:hypothetical protein